MTESVTPSTPITPTTSHTDTPSTPSASATPSKDRAWETRPLKILLVDDNVSFVSTLAILLQDRGHEVTTAVNYQEAVACLHSQGDLLDVMLLDVDIPLVDATRALWRSNVICDVCGHRKIVPRVIISGLPITQLPIDLPPNVPVLLKPTDPEILIAILEATAHGRTANFLKPG